jgi:general stress protein CsbA
LVAFATLALVLRLNWKGWATLSIVAWALIASAMLSLTHAWTAVLLLGLSALALCVGSLAATLPRRRKHRGPGV